jgi:hypothetical protein
MVDLNWHVTVIICFFNLLQLMFYIPIIVLYNQVINYNIEIFSIRPCNKWYRYYIRKT